MEQQKSLVLSALEPFTYINMLAMAGSAVWLIFTPYYLLISFGALVLVFYQFIMPIALMPAGFFSNFMIFFQKMGKPKLENAFLVASISYLLLFLSFWCVLVLNISLSRIGEGGILPGVIFANAAAFTTLFLWVREDKENFFMIRLVQSAQIIMILLTIVKVLAMEITFWQQIGFFFASLSTVVLLQVLYDEFGKK